MNGGIQYDPDLLSLLDRIYEDRSGSAFPDSLLKSLADLFHANSCHVTLRKSGEMLSESGSILSAKIGRECIVLVRPSAKSFRSREKSLWRIIVHHLRRAFELRKQSESFTSDKNIITSILDCLPIGIALVNTGSKILIANSSARAVFDQRDGLCVNNNILIASSRQKTGLLREQILLVGGRNNRSDKGAWMLITRPSHLRGYSVLLFPLSSTPNREQAGEYRIVVLVIADPERKVTVNTQMLKNIFKLTSAETKLVEHLIAGVSISQTADVLKISVDAAYERLKSIFKKTSARRQSDLMRILLLSPAVLTGEAHVPESSEL